MSELAVIGYLLVSDASVATGTPLPKCVTSIMVAPWPGRPPGVALRNAEARAGANRGERRSRPSRTRFLSSKCVRATGRCPGRFPNALVPPLRGGVVAVVDLDRRTVGGEAALHLDAVVPIEAAADLPLRRPSKALGETPIAGRDPRLGAVGDAVRFEAETAAEEVLDLSARELRPDLRVVRLIAGREQHGAAGCATG